MTTVVRVKARIRQKGVRNKWKREPSWSTGMDIYAHMGTYMDM